MGKTIDELVVGLSVDAKKFNAELGRATNAVKQDTEKMKRSFSSIKGQLFNLKTAIAGAFVAAGIKTMIDASNKQEQATEDLNVALEQTGRYTKDISKHFQKLSDEIQNNANFANEDVQRAEALMITLTNLKKKGLDEATKGAVGLAHVFHIDLNSAATLVAKGLAGNVGALSRYGIMVDKTLSPMEKQHQILEQLGQMYDQATKAAKTDAGEMKQMALQIGDLKEKGGDLIKNFLRPLISVLIKAFKFLNSLSKAVQNSIGRFIALIAVLGTLQKVLMAFNLSLGPAGWIIAGIAALVTIIDIVVQKTVGWAAVWDVVRKSALIFWNFFKAFINSVKAYVVGIGNIFKSFGTIAVGVFTGSFKKIKQGWNDLKNAPKEFLSTVKENFTKAGANAVDIWNKTKKKIEDSPAVGELKIKKSGGSEAAGAFGLDPAKTEEAANRILEVHQNLSDETLAIRGTTKQAEIDMIGEVGQAQQQNTDDMQNALMEFEGNVQQSLTPFADSFYNMSKGIGTNWKKTWEKAGDFWLKSFLRKMMQGVSKLVTAVLVGENTKQTAFLKTAAIAISTGARETWAALRSAGASIYAALAKIAQSLASLGPFAIPAIAAAGVALWAIFSKFKSVIGLAKGGRIDQPTAALIGESGPEIVAPESDFLDYTKQILSQIAQAITQMIQTIQTPIINAIVPMAQVQMAGAASLAVSVPASGSISDVKIDEAIAILEQIRDKETTLEVTNEISGNDLYQIVKAEEKEQSRLER